eukprot:c11735_g1_i1 orf=526-723(-)
MFMQSIHKMAAWNGNNKCSPTCTYGVGAEIGLFSITSRTDEDAQGYILHVASWTKKKAPIPDQIR